MRTQRQRAGSGAGATPTMTPTDACCAIAIRKKPANQSMATRLRLPLTSRFHVMWPHRSRRRMQYLCSGRNSVRSRTCDVLTSRRRTRRSAAAPQICVHAKPRGRQCPGVVRRRGWSSPRTSAAASIISYFPVEFVFCLHGGQRHCGHTRRQTPNCDTCAKHMRRR